MYGCKTWALTKEEENRFRVFEKKVLRKKYGPKKDEETGEWRKLHNDELRNLYASSNITRIIQSRRLGWAGHVARMGDYRTAARVMRGKPNVTRPLGRPRRRWEDYVWVTLAQNMDAWKACVAKAINLQVPNAT